MDHRYVDYVMSVQMFWKIADISQKLISVNKIQDSIEMYV